MLCHFLLWGGMPKQPDMLEFYTDNHDQHDNFIATKSLWKNRENIDNSEESPEEYSIYTWYE